MDVLNGKVCPLLWTRFFFYYMLFNGIGSLWGEKGPQDFIILKRTKHITPFKVFILAKTDIDGIREITG